VVNPKGRKLKFPPPKEKKKKGKKGGKRQSLDLIMPCEQSTQESGEEKGGGERANPTEKANFFLPGSRKKGKYQRRTGHSKKKEKGSQRGRMLAFCRRRRRFHALRRKKGKRKRKRVRSSFREKKGKRGENLNFFIRRGGVRREALTPKREGGGRAKNYCSHVEKGKKKNKQR